MQIQVNPLILLVEDDQELAEMYQLQLEHLGYEVTTAKTAQEAIERLEARMANLILLDILLPQENGLSVLHELRSYTDWQQIPVIVLSNIGAQELGINQVLLKRLGVFAYLEKAKAKPSVLKATIASALSRPVTINDE